MSVPRVTLHGVVFGEHLEGVPERSLGFRLLAPLEPQPWAAEVETLARRLQAAPYPDRWPAADYFSSVLLGDGQRLVALVRYGLVDHTRSRRRGGLELVGVVGPAAIGVDAALAVYRWLRQRRREAEELRNLGGQFFLPDIIETGPALPVPDERTLVLPVRLWQEGVLLFAATSPGDPDLRLGLLEQSAGETWQWLPLVGPDFPLQTFAKRGPVIAWTVQQAGAAVRLDGKGDEHPPRRSGRRRLVGVVGAAALACLLVANLWTTLALYRRRAAAPIPEEPTRQEKPLAADEGSLESFAEALFRHLEKHHAAREWTQNTLIDHYHRLADRDPRLRVTSEEGRAAVGAADLLAARSTTHIEALVREALAHKGYDSELVNLACRRIRERLAADAEAP
jgi:hypothetical protein